MYRFFVIPKFTISKSFNSHPYFAGYFQTHCLEYYPDHSRKLFCFSLIQLQLGRLVAGIITSTRRYRRKRYCRSPPFVNEFTLSDFILANRFSKHNIPNNIPVVICLMLNTHARFYMQNKRYLLAYLLTYLCLLNKIHTSLSYRCRLLYT